MSESVNSSGILPRRLYLFSLPRTRSNLLLKLFEKHPELCVLRYMFRDAWMYGPEHLRTRENMPHLDQPHQETCEELREETFQRAFERLMIRIREAESQAKMPFIKEHVISLVTPTVMAEGMDRMADSCGRLSNGILKGVFEKQREWRQTWETPVISDGEGATDDKHQDTATSLFLLPDSFVKSIQPVMIIRHPIHLFSSYYSVSPTALGAHVDDSDFPIIAASYAILRLLYDHFTTQGQKRPIVIDGDDIVRDPQAVAERFCSATGIDPSGVQYTWDPETSEAMEKMGTGQRLFLEALMTSSRIDIRKDLEVNPDIQLAEEKWSVKHGKDVASKLKGYAEASLEDYRFLRSKKL